MCQSTSYQGGEKKLPDLTNVIRTFTDLILKFNMFNQAQTIIVYNSTRCGDQPTTCI